MRPASVSAICRSRSTSYYEKFDYDLFWYDIADLRGGRITFARASVRFFAKILSTNILLIGYLMALFTEKKQTPHDLLVSIVVIETNKMDT
jgi:RDD family